jgi:hypothetical protein
MNIITNLSAKQLRQAAKIKEKIQTLEGKVNRILGPSSTPTPTAAPKKRRMSAAARARITAAQKARWAKVKSHAANPAHSPKRKISSAARAKMAAAARARWKKAKAAGRKRL